MVGVFQHLGRSVQNRPHFFIALFIGIVTAGILTWLTSWKWSTILLVSWNASVSIYLLHVWQLMKSADHSQMQQQAKKQDESKWVIMLIVLLALIMCLVAILIQLSQLPSESSAKLGHVAFSFTHHCVCMAFYAYRFALHYAHDFYIALSRNEENGGLDFLAQSSQLILIFYILVILLVLLLKLRMCQLPPSTCVFLNLFHAVLSFGFNTTILAICINVAAGFLTN